ncbi:MAG: hypothetical protein AAF674_22765 [Pseudomonadota bacterium]
MSAFSLARAGALGVCFLALLGCQSIDDAAFPTRELAVEFEGNAYKVINNYDPTVPGYFNWVSAVDGRMKGSDRALAIRVVEEAVGPQVCDGQNMVFEEGAIWGGVGPNYATFQPTIHRWIIIADCP